MTTSPDLPSAELLRRQAEWLAPARARLLRRADVARRRSVLDIGCGPGATAEELKRRCAGRVVAIDCRRSVFEGGWPQSVGAAAVCASAAQLPLADGAFDMAFCQFTLLWLDASAAIREIRRVLAPGGVFAAIEPDFGGLIEHPPELAVRPLWLAGLARANADPCVGRKLPALLSAAGFSVHVDLLDRLEPPSPLRFAMLAGLPLNDAELALLRSAEQADRELSDAARVVHLPIFLIRAEVSKA